MAKNKKTGVPHYELLYIVPNKYTEEDLLKINQEVETMISEAKGKITFKQNWGKKKFCYPINHSRFGYYCLIEFDLSADKIAKINTDLRMDNKVLRYMIVNRAAKTPEEIEAEIKQAESRAIKAAKKAPIKEEVKKEAAPAKPKVDSKELDEKLNKILETDDLL
jgi:small subunit ribosomal protein S6